MGMGSICVDCTNRFHCTIDSSANVQRCAMYNTQPDLSEVFDMIADKVAEKVVEKLKSEKQ